MNRGKYFLIGIVLILMLLSTTVSSISIINTNIFEKQRVTLYQKESSIEVTTDKTVYSFGETVTIILTNVGEELLCVTGPYIRIYNEEKEIVFEDACYCYWELQPDQYVTMYWYNPQVPAGEYEVKGILSDDENDYIDIAIFYIINYNPPSPPTGPNEGVVGVVYTFCIDLPDNEQCEPYYISWDYGDGSTSEWVGPFGAGETVCGTHYWSLPGYYEIRAKIKDGCQNEYWSEPLIIHIIDNNKPSSPVITGLTNVTVGVQYEWSYLSVDPDGDNITYYVDWGDQCGSGKYYGPYHSGQELVLSHVYTYKATLFILSVAIDEHGAESEPTYFEVTILKSKIVEKSFIHFILERLQILFPMIKNLL